MQEETVAVIILLILSIPGLLAIGFWLEDIRHKRMITRLDRRIKEVDEEGNKL